MIAFHSKNPSPLKLACILLFASVAATSAQDFSFTTLAGPLRSQGNQDGEGRNARFNGPSAAAFDTAGNMYVADTFNNLIRKITPAGRVSTFAGSTDPSVVTGISRPVGVAVDTAGNVYVANSIPATISKITAGGVVITLAGASDAGPPVDGQGTSARFIAPSGIAVDSSGNVYVADGRMTLGNRTFVVSNTIRKITPTGMVSTLAGNSGVIGNSDGTGTAAQFNQPVSLALDEAGNLYVGDSGNRNVRKVTSTGVVTTLASFVFPRAVAVNRTGTVFVSDATADESLIRSVSPAGIVTTLGGRSFGYSDGLVTAAQFSNNVAGLAVDQDGNLGVVDTGNNAIRKISPAGVVTTIAGRGLGTAFDYAANPIDGWRNAAWFARPEAIALDSAGNCFIADSVSHTIRRITPTGVVTTLAGTAGVAGSRDGVGVAAQFNSPRGVAVDGAGGVWVADTGNACIRKISAAGVVSTVAASVGPVRSAAADSAGNFYVIDRNAIRKITADGTTTTYAGDVTTRGREDGIGSNARFWSLIGLAMDSADNLYVLDELTIRKITPDRVVTTIFSGLPNSNALGIDSNGKLYLVSGTRSDIFVVSPVGTITPLNLAFPDMSFEESLDRQWGAIAVTANGSLIVADTRINQIEVGVTEPVSKITAISVRANAGTGAQTLIGGFIVTGGGKNLVVRGIGPALTAYGVTDALPSARMTLYSGGQAIASNTGWRNVANAGDVAATFARAGLFQLPDNNLDAALVTAVNSGPYTVHVNGPSVARGTALADVYDIDPLASPGRLIAVSSRSDVGTGEAIVIAGFVIAGNSPLRVIVRAVGPALAGLGFSGVLTAPQLTLYSGGDVISTNAGWNQGADARTIPSVSAQLGQLPLAQGSSDSVLLVTLRPGNYTAQVSGTAGTTGLSLIEVYEAP